VLGTNVKFTKGNMSSIAAESKDKSAFQMSVPVQPGNSGGPVCNAKGDVCGVVRSGWYGKTFQNVNEAVVSELLIKLCQANSVKLSEPGDSSESAEQRAVKASYLIVVESIAESK
jgi:hypothetical protein